MPYDKNLFFHISISQSISQVSFDITSGEHLMSKLSFMPISILLMGQFQGLLLTVNSYFIRNSIIISLGFNLVSKDASLYLETFTA